MKLFLDMDGVVANFIQASIDALGLTETISPNDIHAWECWHDMGISEGKFWAAQRRIRDFWMNIKPYKNASHFVDRLHHIIGGEVVFISSPTKYHMQCCYDKYRWLQKHFNDDYADSLLLAKRKQICAAKDRILVDDNTDNLDAWRKAGGIAVLFPRPWNTDCDFNNLTEADLQQSVIDVVKSKVE